MDFCKISSRYSEPFSKSRYPDSGPEVALGVKGTLDLFRSPGPRHPATLSWPPSRSVLVPAAQLWSDGCFGTVRTGWMAQFRAAKRPRFAR